MVFYHNFETEGISLIAINQCQYGCQNLIIWLTDVYNQKIMLHVSEIPKEVYENEPTLRRNLSKKSTM